MEVREANAVYLTQAGSACPPGYKQTEVGVIPEDWVLNYIENLAHITTGGKNTQDRVDDGQYPFFVRSQTVERINSYSFDGEAVLTAGDGVGTGKVFHYIKGKFDAHQRVYRIADFREHISGYFFYLYFSSHFYNRIMQMTAKSSVDSVRREMIARMLIPLPPTKAEQEAIAGALSDADGLIESLEQLIAKKRHLKQGAMQELLVGKKRLPGFSGEWEVKRLGGMLTICHGKSQRGVEVANGPYPILATGGEIGRTNRFLYDKPSVMIGRKGTIDTPQYMDTPFWTVDTLFYSAVHEPNDAKYIFYRFCLIDWKQHNEASGVPSLNARTIENILVCSPVPAEQTAIAAILSDLDAELVALETKLAKAHRIKQGMMEELLTGRIRLVQPAARIIPIPTRNQAAPAASKSHNWQINEAVIIGVLAKNFGSEKFPLARKRCTKLTYLLHRQVERQAEGYLKKAAGPYNPATRYKGPEGIALKNRYVRQLNTPYPGFVAAGNSAEAEAYFSQWYGPEVLPWLEQFRYRKTDELELLTTVDMAMEDLRREGQEVNLGAVKQVIRNHPEWEAKLEREIFADSNIIRAMTECREILGD